jgi:hypothetical protein
MYLAKYSGENGGRLRFDEVTVRPLCEESAYVTGQWRVIYADTTKSGFFTLIFRRFDEGWRIVHDHTS